jgi:hypothetical protein
MRWSGVIDREIRAYDCFYEIDVFYMKPLPCVVVSLSIVQKSHFSSEWWAKVQLVKRIPLFAEV